jgi:hypothetical protein
VEGVKGADDEGVDVDEGPDGALEDFSVIVASSGKSNRSLKVSEKRSPSP